MEPQTKKSRTRYKCDQCDRTFQHSSHMLRHKRTSHGNGAKLECPTCNLHFNRRDNLKRHMKRHGQIGGANVEQESQQVTTHEDQPNQHEDEQQDGEVCNEQALGGTIRKVILPAAGMEKYDLTTFLKVNFEKVKKSLKDAILERGALKWYLSVQLEMIRWQGNEMDKAEPHFRGKCQIALKPEDLEMGLRDSIVKIFNSFVEYQRRGSNWTLNKIKDVTIHMARYRPLRGSSYIPLPIKIRQKKAVVNIQNRDHKCFMWSVLAALHPVKVHAERTHKYRNYTNELNFNGIPFPVTLADIPKFETQNQISINVFGYEKGEVFPRHVTMQRHDRHVNLLMIDDGRKSHYCWIKNLNRLLGDQHSHCGTYHYCPYCITGFTKKRILEDHIAYCQTHGVQKIKLPSEDDKWLFYKDQRKQLKAPFIIYADFESLQVPISGCSKDIFGTEKKTLHVPSGFAYKVVGPTPELSRELMVYRGPDPIDRFVQDMVKLQEELEQLLREVKPLEMTGSDWKNFRNAIHCHICHGELGTDRVRDHCHMTGKFRGAAHNKCNINFKYTGRMPVVFHNLKGYDSHLIMQAVGKVNKELKCIPTHMEKYISFSMGCMDFIDSFQFMPSSLEKLIQNLAKEEENKFLHMAQQFGEDKLDLLTKKQIYPYEYFDSDSRFEETSLPPIEAFYSTLSDTGITTDDHAHAQKMWKEFGIQNLGEYHDLYVATDVLALADVFENFRATCLQYYELDPAHFYTSPGLAWQAALKMTGVQLELLTDIDMHLFIEKGLRGGISVITHRYAKANNKHIPGYKINEPESHIMYLDANNLYGWAMSQSLPTHDFRWVNEEEVKKLDVTQIPDDSPEGYILEVDIDYPNALHDLHNDYPLAPERIKVTSEMLSPYAERLIEDLGLKDTSTEKLIPNLRPKEKYVIHYRNLKLYLSLGMQLTKVHRVMTFQQRPWLKEYIDFNTEKGNRPRINLRRTSSRA